MIHEIEQFGIKLYSEQDDFPKKPPLTYETYNATLQQHLMKFKSEIIAVEKDLMKQGTYNETLNIRENIIFPIYDYKIYFQTASLHFCLCHRH